MVCCDWLMIPVLFSFDRNEGWSCPSASFVLMTMTHVVEALGIQSVGERGRVFHGELEMG